MNNTETLKEKADRWMDSNPEIMHHFRKFSNQLRQTNRRFGMKLLAERVRWEIAISGDYSDFKVNNNYVAYIGRRLIKEDPSMGKYINTRSTRSANLPARDPQPSR